MHDKSSVEFHREVIDLRKQESKLKKLLSIPRQKLEQEELIESLRDVQRDSIASSPSRTRSLNLRTDGDGSRGKCYCGGRNLSSWRLAETRNGYCERDLVTPFGRPVERPITAQERDHVTIMFVGLMWKHERFLSRISSVPLSLSSPSQSQSYEPPPGTKF